MSIADLSYIQPYQSSRTRHFCPIGYQPKISAPPYTLSICSHIYAHTYFVLARRIWLHFIYLFEDVFIHQELRIKYQRDYIIYMIYLQSTIRIDCEW